MIFDSLRNINIDGFNNIDSCSNYFMYVYIIKF